MMRSIRDIFEKSNHDVIVVTIVILVGFAGFGLGRLSTFDESEGGSVRITSNSDFEESGEKEGSVSTAAIESIPDGAIVASRNGSKYHFPWCPGAQQMKEENKIWFDTTEKARSAGYEPAANCKGLK